MIIKNNKHTMIYISMCALFLGIHTSVFSKCLSCADKAEIKQAIKNMLAMQIALEKTNTDADDIVEREDSNKSEVQHKMCCENCAMRGGECCQGKTCGCMVTKAPREAIVDESNPAFPVPNDCCEEIEEELCFINQNSSE